MSITYKQLKEAFPEEAKEAEIKTNAFINKLIKVMWELYKKEFGIE